MHPSTQTSNLKYVYITLPSSPSFLTPSEKIQDEKKDKGGREKEGGKNQNQKQTIQYVSN
jgi:hypothetical protein